MINNLLILLYGSRIIVPTALQQNTVDKIHCGHLKLGIQKCLPCSKRSELARLIDAEREMHAQIARG